MPASAVHRIPIRFDGWYRAVSTAFLILPSGSYVELDGEIVTVRMSWAFRASFPRSSILGASRPDVAPVSRGVHGFAGRWLVNGAGDRLLTMVLEPAQRARVLGVPVQLRELTVSVDDPDGLAERLRSSR